MDLEAFDYHLPPRLIAKYPCQPRDQSRLLAVNRKDASISHRSFSEIDQLLNPNDLLVINNTKVLPARIFGFDKNNRKLEVLLLRPVCPDSLRWECLIKPRSKLSSPSLVFDNDVQAEIGHPRGMLNQINFWNLKVPFSEWLSTHGSTPLPPYIKRKSEVADSANYQTIYAKIPGSVAAPTAGLHFTDSLLRTLENKSVQIAELTLHVGYGTFAPIRSNPVEEHFMYNEAYQIPPHTMELLLKAKANKLRIIAVGTSTVRALESISLVGYGGETSLFVYPGYRFRWVDGLITNFHLPRSSLFVLVSAFLGLELTRTCYQQAISRNYRFYSYGDAMFIR